MSERTQNKSIIGVIWALTNKYGVVLLQFVVNLILARLLSPAEFGVVGMILIFIVISQTLVDSGFDAALIQKLNPTKKDYSTVFYWNIGVSVILYGVIYISSPAIGAFFRMPEIGNLLRVLGCVVVLDSLASVHRALLRKNLEIKKVAIVGLISYALSSVIAVILAEQGAGPWSLVWMRLANGFTCAVLFSIVSRWRPSFTFSFSSLKELFSYGGFIFISNLMQGICAQIQGVLIGRYFTPAQTGMYTQAKKMDDIASWTAPSAIMQVVFPLYSERQNNLESLCALLRRSLRMISYLMYPLLGILIVISKPLIVFLFGSAWEDAAECFQILCVGGLFSSVHIFNYHAIAALGKSRLLFRVAVYQWCVLLALLFLGVRFGLNAVLWAMVISNINIYLVNGYLVQRYIGYQLTQQVRDIAPNLLCAGVSILAVWGLKYFAGWHWIGVATVFGILYLALSFMFHLRAFTELSSSFRLILTK